MGEKIVFGTAVAFFKNIYVSEDFVFVLAFWEAKKIIMYIENVRREPI